MRVVIIGAIAAGMSAAAKLRRVDKEAEIIVFEKQEYVSFGACGLPYYVGDYFDDVNRMLVRTPDQIRGMGIELHLRHEVTSVDAKEKQVVVKDLEANTERVVSYDRLMVATGASAIVPPIKNQALANVHMLRTLEDGEQVRRLMLNESVRKVAIIGAGFIGLEVAEAAKRQGKEVSIFQLEERILKDAFDAEITELLEEELRNQGVNLYVNTMVTELKGSDKVEAVLAGNVEVEADLVVIATGVRPNTAFLKDTGVEMLPNGAIIIDAAGRTSVEDIYSAGDCATVPHRLKAAPAYIPLATTANKLGRILGENLALPKGEQKEFEGTLGSACLKLLDLEAGRTGLCETEAVKAGLEVKTVVMTDKNHTDYYPGQEPITVKLVYDAKTKVILGGQVVGKSDAVQRTNVLAAAIAAKMTTEQLAMLDLCYAPPFSRTWDALNIAGSIAK